MRHEKTQSASLGDVVFATPVTTSYCYGVDLGGPSEASRRPWKNPAPMAHFGSTMDKAVYKNKGWLGEAGSDRNTLYFNPHAEQRSPSLQVVAPR